MRARMRGLPERPRASREERAGLRELSSVLKRDQARYKNFSLFDRMKADASRAAMVLKLLPVWIMAYCYKDQVHRFLVNGQTGQCTGTAPTSYAKIASVVGIVIAVVIAIIVCMGLIAAMSGR